MSIRSSVSSVAYICGWIGILGIAAVRLGVLSSPVLFRATEMERGARAPSIGTVDYSASAKTVVLVIRSGCKFCTASMDFYRRLASAESVRTGRARVIVTGNESADVLRNYVRQHGFQPSDIVSAALPTKGTPTLFIVGRKGTIESLWLGKVSDETERQIIDDLSPSSTSARR